MLPPIISAAARSLLFVILCLAAILGPVPLAGQTPTPPILVVVSATSPNPYGPYLGEILKTEGLPAFAVRDIATVTPGQLAAAKLVVLAEMPLTLAQAQLIIAHVAGGGRLIAMHPDAQLAPTLGVTPAATSQLDGYLAIDQAQVGAGLSAVTLPFSGNADHYTLVSPARSLAQLYSSLTQATPYPAVVRFNRTATWTFDLARSVVYRRQGNPALAGFERDGLPIYRTQEPFYGVIDRERVDVPHVDVQMRLFSRTVVDLLADEVPMPRLWYFPGGKRALMIVAGDAHNHGPAIYDALIAKVESVGGRMTIYPARWLPYPTAAVAAQWRQRGHELGVHPIGAADGLTLPQAYAQNLAYFAAAGWGTPGPTARSHDQEWLGWTDGAVLAAANGVKMEISMVTWGPALGPNVGPQAKGYISGSGLPMRFATTTGSVIPVFQQITTLSDHLFFTNNGYSEQTTSAGALAYTRQFIDEAVSKYHTAFATQFQLDYYNWEAVHEWVDGTLDYAAAQGLPLWTTEHWAAYTASRDATTLESPTFDAGNGRMQFVARVPAQSESLTLMLATTHLGASLTGVTVNGAPVTVTTQTINGRTLAFFPLPATSSAEVPYNVVAQYGTGGGGDETPPVVTALTASATGSSTASVSWATNEPATSRVEYGIGALIAQTTLDTTLVTSHAVALAGLTPGATYQYRAESRDASGNIATSGVLTFTTPSPVPALSVNDVSVTEGTGGTRSAVFTVSLSAPSASTVTVTYATASGTATSPADFTAVSAPLTFAPGATTQTLAVPIATDSTVESTETFTVVLSNPVNATIVDGTGVGTIVDDDVPAGGPVTITVNVAGADSDANETNGALESAASVWIGNAGAGLPSYTAMRFAGVAVPRGATVTSARLEVRAASTAWNALAFEVAAESSANAAPFTGAALPSGRPLTTARVSHQSDVQWVVDTWYQLDQIAPLVQEVVNRGDWSAGNALAIVLRGTGNAWGRKFARAYEADPASAPRLSITYTGGGAPALPTIAVNDVSVTEGTGGTSTATFAVTLSAASAQPVTVAYATADGTAVAPGDYSAGSGTVTFNAGVTAQTVSVPIVTDNVIESNETFSLNLSAPSNATLADGTGVATIVNDDVSALPALNINDVSVAEGTGGASAAVFTVTLSAASGQVVTVAYATANGTAVAPGDFTAGAGTLTFAAGATSQTLSVPIVTDNVVEANETFTLTLSAPSNATLAGGIGVATIVNDDAATGPVTATFQIIAGGDDVNQDGTALMADSTSLWVGNGAAASYTGLRFTGVSIPRNATVTSARLEVNAAATQWISLGFEYGIEAAAASAAFSTASLPSQRTLLATRATHASNTQWVSGTWVTLDPLTAIVQELVNRPDWTSGNAMSLILRGTSGAWARKVVHAFEDGSAVAPRLVVTYIP